MNYQNILCVGDSQTFGARSYGCYPLYLAKMLSDRSPYEWRAINLSHNHYTARDLWIMLNQRIDTISDVYLACLIIGTNDIGEDNDVELFEEYYRQILRMFFIKRYRIVLCGEIPPIFPDGHVFFKRETAERRELFNETIQEVVGEFPEACFVRFEGLKRDDYEDPVHFSEKANLVLAESFCEVILKL